MYNELFILLIDIIARLVFQITVLLWCNLHN